ncbi:MAG: sodium:proton antiporter [Clostridia bacterium]|nr:sodium:proton antiporter [Clostridia bacterium]
MDNPYALMMQSAMIVLGICLFVCLYRAVRGPRTADRVIAVNMIGTVTIMLILFLALLLQEGYLVDIALIYAMLSFLAVVLLCRIYIGIHRARKEREGSRNA